MALNSGLIFANTSANKNKLTETLASPMANYGLGASGYETIYDNEGPADYLETKRQHEEPVVGTETRGRLGR